MKDIRLIGLRSPGVKDLMSDKALVNKLDVHLKELIDLDRIDYEGRTLQRKADAVSTLLMLRRMVKE
jgi:hypothetical protein